MEKEIPGLLAHYLLNNSTKVINPGKSKEIVDGVVIGAKLTVDRKGNQNSAYKFDGNSARIDCGIGPKPVDAITMSAWVKPSDVGCGNFHIIIDHHSGYELQERGDDRYRIYIHVEQHGWICCMSTVPVTVGKWYHVVGTYDSENGMFQCSVNGQITTKTIEKGRKICYTGVDKMTIGCENNERGRFFQGNIDDVRIYDRAMTEEEILYLYHSGSGSFTFSFKDVQEAEERFDYVVENMSDLEVPLLNKTLNLSKTMMNQSSELSKAEKEYRGLSKVKLELEETVIYNVMLGEKINMSLKTMVDYWIFFKTMKMPREMFLICTAICEVKASFCEIYEVFMEFCKANENDRVKSWFGKNPQTFGTIAFDSSLALSLFNRMKMQESELLSDKEAMLMEKANIMYYLLKNCWVIDQLLDHRDFGKIQRIESSLLCKKSFFLSQIGRRAKKEGNVVLKTTDGGSVRAFLDILVLQSSFFFRMIRFGGSEFEEMKKKGSISLEEVYEKDLLAILHFYHEGEIVEDDFEVLMRCVVHGEKFSERNLFEAATGRLRKLISKNKKEEIAKLAKFVEETKGLMGVTVRSSLLNILEHCGMEEKEFNSLVKKI